MRYLSNYSRFSKIYEKENQEGNENKEGNENQGGETVVTGSEAQAAQDAIEQSVDELTEGDPGVAQILGKLGAENSSFRTRGRFSRIYEKLELDEYVKIPTEAEIKTKVEEFSKAVDNYIVNKQWNAIFELPKDVVVQETSDIYDEEEIPGNILTFKKGVKLMLRHSKIILGGKTPALAVKYAVVGDRNDNVYTENKEKKSLPIDGMGLPPDGSYTICFVKYQLTREEEEHVNNLFGDFGKKIEANYEEALDKDPRKMRKKADSHFKRQHYGVVGTAFSTASFLSSIIPVVFGAINPVVAPALAIAGVASWLYSRREDKKGDEVRRNQRRAETELKYAKEVLNKFKFLAVYLKSVMEPQGKKVTDLVLKNIMDIIENGSEFKGI